MTNHLVLVGESIYSSKIGAFNSALVVWHYWRSSVNHPPIVNDQCVTWILEPDLLRLDDGQALCDCCVNGRTLTCRWNNKQAVPSE